MSSSINDRLYLSRPDSCGALFHQRDGWNSLIENEFVCGSTIFKAGNKSWFLIETTSFAWFLLLRISQKKSLADDLEGISSVIYKKMGGYTRIVPFPVRVFLCLLRGIWCEGQDRKQ